jgi:hypothetical protein
VSNAAAAAAAGASVGCASNAVRASDGVCALAGVQSVYVYICVCVFSTAKKTQLGMISARGVILDIVGSIVHSTVGWCEKESSCQYYTQYCCALPEYYHVVVVEAVYR